MKVPEGCHSGGLGGGHSGRDKTLAKINERYYWMGMVDDVKDFCRRVTNVKELIGTNSNHKAIYENLFKYLIWMNGSHAIKMSFNA